MRRKTENEKRLVRLGAVYKGLLAYEQSGTCKNTSDFNSIKKLVYERGLEARKTYENKQSRLSI